MYMDMYVKPTEYLRNANTMNPFRPSVWAWHASTRQKIDERL